MEKLVTCTLVLLFFLVTSGVNGAFNVLSFGAKGDGTTDSAASFTKAWTAACSTAGTVAIVVPKGRYLITRATFNGPCKSKTITFQINGTLITSTNYGAYGNGYWLLFNKVQGLTILGGALDGKGKGVWDCKNAGKKCPEGAKSLTINNGRDILIKDMRSINSQTYHLGLNSCQNVRVQGVQLLAPGNSPNTDGIHIQDSTGITITGSIMKTGDDCISLGPGTRNFRVESVSCGPGHGFSIGSLAKELKEDGVENITVKQMTFKGTQNGVRIKSWPRPSTGYVKNVLFQDIIMENVNNPVLIDQNYCPGNVNCPNQSSGVKVSGVRYQNVRGSSSSEVAVKFDCSKGNPCSGIELQDVKLTYQNGRAKSVCINADGTSRGLVDPPSCL